MGLFQVLAGVRRRRKLVYSKPLPIRSMSLIGDNNVVVLNLARPFRGKVQVQVNGLVVAASGAMTVANSSAFF